jgi:hypothetical protein
MKELKPGMIVGDGAGTKGKVLRVEYVPADGRGHPSRDDIYVDWGIGLNVDEDFSQEKHGQ